MCKKCNYNFNIDYGLKSKGNKNDHSNIDLQKSFIFDIFDVLPRVV